MQKYNRTVRVSNFCNSFYGRVLRLRLVILMEKVSVINVSRCDKSISICKSLFYFFNVSATININKLIVDVLFIFRDYCRKNLRKLNTPFILSFYSSSVAMDIEYTWIL